MNVTPAVSVVLIFFNDERFLPEAIASVFGQRFTEWELILADDGSTDASTDLARETALAHPEKVHYVDHPGHANCGPAATRNLGVRASSGRYVAVLDSDDVWEPMKLGEQVAILEAHPEVGLVVGASHYWWSWAGESAERADRPMPIGVPADRAYPPPELALRLYPLGRGVAPCPSSWLLRRELIDRVGGWEEHIRPVYEDQGFLAKAYHETSVWVSSRSWDRYRRHPGQLVSVTDSDGYHAARREFLRWYEDHLRRHGIGDARVWRAMGRAWWPYRHPRLAASRRAAGMIRARLRRRVRSIAPSAGQGPM